MVAKPAFSDRFLAREATIDAFVSALLDES